MHSSKVLHIHIKKQQNNNISYEHAYTFLKGTSHTNKAIKSDTDTHTHSSKVLHIQIKIQNNKTTKQQNNKISYTYTYAFLKSTSHTNKQQNNKKTKSHTRTLTHSSKVLHIQIKKQQIKTKQQNNKI